MLTAVFDCFPSSQAFGPRDYLVYEQDRVTYTQAHARVRQLAAYLQTLGVAKGQRVALCLRNSPDWVISFWAIHMLGAVVVAVNCFNTADVVAHCVTMSGSVVAILDEERMVALEGWKGKLKEGGCPTLLVVRANGKVASGCRCLRTELDGFEASDLGEVAVEPEDNATIFFTSGTSGLPKGVLSTQRQFLSNLLNSLVAGNRAILRAGGDLPVPNPDDPQRTYLLVSPLHHLRKHGPRADLPDHRSRCRCFT
jgi:acyl-CoA synthetase (AMP-forming)/AMP-acid ligase II